MFNSLDRTKPVLTFLVASLFGVWPTQGLRAAPAPGQTPNQTPPPGVITSLALDSKATQADTKKWVITEVRSQIPKGAISIFAGRYTVGGSPVLVHLWTTPRANAAKASYARTQSPYCIDLLSLYALDGEKPQWHVVTSAIYLGESAPRQIDVRYLHPAKKQGLVLVIYSPVYMTSRMSLVVFPEGANEGTTNPVKDFYGYGPGGGSVRYKFGTDSTDTLNLTVESSYQGKLQSSTVYSWKENEFVAGPTIKAR